MFTETIQFKQGDWAQRRVAELLQELGWHIIPSYDYTGSDANKSPRMAGRSGFFVIPDLDISKDGSRHWVEVKFKNDATWTRRTGQYEHGIDLRHYREYLEVEQITGAQVWLFIIERSSAEVLYERLSRLGPVKREVAAKQAVYGKGGMVYFPRDAFNVLSKIDIPVATLALVSAK